MELYGGALLPGFYDQWILPEAQRLEECFFAALRRLASQLERSGELEESLHFARRGASMNALREDVARDLMRLYGATGQPALARRQYYDLEKSLHRSLSTSPCLQTRELLRRIEGEASQFQEPPAKSQISVPSAPETLAPASRGEAEATPIDGLKVAQGTMPPQWTRFIGRAPELAQVQRLLQNGARLVTLTGTGGTGKTRLSLEVALLLQHEREERRNALWFASLADVTMPAWSRTQSRAPCACPSPPRLRLSFRSNRRWALAWNRF